MDSKLRFMCFLFRAQANEVSNETGMSLYVVAAGYTTTTPGVYQDCYEENFLMDTLDIESGLNLAVYNYTTGGTLKTVPDERGFRDALADALRKKGKEYLAAAEWAEKETDEAQKRLEVDPTYVWLRSLKMHPEDAKLLVVKHCMTKELILRLKPAEVHVLLPDVSVGCRFHILDALGAPNRIQP